MVLDGLVGTATVTTQGPHRRLRHDAKSGDIYLATSGDLDLATSGDLDLATSGDFFMATDTPTSGSTGPWCSPSIRPLPGVPIQLMVLLPSTRIRPEDPGRHRGRCSEPLGICCG